MTTRPKSAPPVSSRASIKRVEPENGNDGGRLGGGDHASLLGTATTATSAGSGSGAAAAENKARAALFGDNTSPSTQQQRGALFGEKKKSNAMVQIRENVDEELADQDVLISEIHDGVKDLEDKANTMNTQITKQSDLLEDIDRDVGKSLTTVEGITRRTTALVKASGGPRPLAIMCCLSAVALVLLVFILYS